MRLIDADALLEDAGEVCEDYGGGYFEFGYSHKQIEEAPTVDAVEVVHGEWVEKDDDRITGTCSVCGWDALFAETDVAGMPYCPNCGARMKGETDE